MNNINENMEASSLAEDSTNIDNKIPATHSKQILNSQWYSTLTNPLSNPTTSLVLTPLL